MADDSSSRDEPPTDPEAGDAAARARSPLVIVAVVAALVLFVAVGVWFVTSPGGEVEEVGSSGTGGIAAAPVGEGMAFGTAGGPIVDIYVDYQCSHCAELDALIGTEIARLAGSGDAEVVIRPVKFLSRASGRGAAALYCADQAGHAFEMHQTLLSDIAADFTVDGLAATAAGMGMDEATFSACLTDDATTTWVNGVNDTAESDGIRGVPAVFVDGTRLTDTQLASGPAFYNAVLQGAS